MREVWNAVRTLKPDYRAAYLLNLPGPGKTRADIEVFVLQGAATGLLPMPSRQKHRLKRW